jgi:hypothetical protein
MITVVQNIITDIEINEFIEYYKNNLDKAQRPENSYGRETVYKFEGISIIDNISDFTFLKRIRYKNYDRIRIQKVDNTIDMILKPHVHTPPFSYVVFLNDDFEGGDIIFDNIRIKPKKGQLLYFDKNESHYVENVINGERYTLVGFTNDAEFNPLKLNLI